MHSKGSSLVLSASYALNGQEIVSKDTCFEKACFEKVGAETQVLTPLARVRDATSNGEEGGQSLRGHEPNANGGAQEELKVEWQEYADNLGRPYFYHVPTDTSVWNRPVCLMHDGSDKSTEAMLLRCPPHLAGRLVYLIRVRAHTCTRVIPV